MRCIAKKTPEVLNEVIMFPSRPPQKSERVPFPYDEMKQFILDDQLSSEAARQYNDAVKHYSDNKYAEAKKLFQSVIEIVDKISEKTKRSENAYYVILAGSERYLSLIFYKDGDYKEAKKHIQLAHKRISEIDAVNWEDHEKIDAIENYIVEYLIQLALKASSEALFALTNAVDILEEVEDKKDKKYVQLKTVIQVYQASLAKKMRPSVKKEQKAKKQKTKEQKTEGQKAKEQKKKDVASSSPAPSPTPLPPSAKTSTQALALVKGNKFAALFQLFEAKPDEAKTNEAAFFEVVKNPSLNKDQENVIVAVKALVCLYSSAKSVKRNLNNTLNLMRCVSELHIQYDKQKFHVQFKSKKGKESKVEKGLKSFEKNELSQVLRTVVQDIQGENRTTEQIDSLLVQIICGERALLKEEPDQTVEAKEKPKEQSKPKEQPIRLIESKKSSVPRVQSESSAQIDSHHAAPAVVVTPEPLPKTSVSEPQPSRVTKSTVATQLVVTSQSDEAKECARLRAEIAKFPFKISYQIEDAIPKIKVMVAELNTNKVLKEQQYILRRYSKLDAQLTTLKKIKEKINEQSSLADLKQFYEHYKAFEKNDDASYRVIQNIRTKLHQACKSKGQPKASLPQVSTPQTGVGQKVKKVVKKVKKVRKPAHSIAQETKQSSPAVETSVTQHNCSSSLMLSSLAPASVATVETVSHPVASELGPSILHEIFPKQTAGAETQSHPVAPQLGRSILHEVFPNRAASAETRSHPVGSQFGRSILHELFPRELLAQVSNGSVPTEQKAKPPVIRGTFEEKDLVATLKRKEDVPAELAAQTTSEPTKASGGVQESFAEKLNKYPVEKDSVFDLIMSCIKNSGIEQVHDSIVPRI